MSGNKRMNMMNKTYIHFALILCMAFFSGCVNVEEFEEPAQKVTKIFYADMENQPGTKTVLGEKDAEGFRTIFWMPEDCIGVASINTNESSFDCFVNQKTELSNRAVFEGKTAVAQEYVAIYPYHWETSIWDNTVYLTLDPVQTYVEGTFEQGAFPMLARTSDSDEDILKFLNLCGILEINLKGTDKIESITFTSGNYVSGLFSVSMDYETEPEMVPAGTNSNILTLKCTEAVQLDESAPTAFCLVLPPAEYQSFTLCIRTVDGKLMFKQSKNPLTITRSRLTAAGALEYMESVSFDLSLRGTSNCYVVPSMGQYKFNATVIGNGASGIIPDANFHTTDPTISPSSVEVLWETKGANVKAESGELLSDVTLTDDGYVEFMSTGVEGNALVAAKDADGTILWSWHIWVTDQPKEQLYKNDLGNFYVLDRSLGATRADRGEADEWKEGKGVLYQWGRKDPISQNNYTLNGTAWERFSIERTIQNPTLLPFANSNRAYWVTPDNNNLWSSVKKTIYDPCPVGYRVPDVEVWAGFVNAEGIVHTSGEYDNGWYFIVNDNASDNLAWYPANDRMIYSGRYYQRITESDFWYTSSFRTFHVDANNVDFAWFEATNASTFSASNVRCMKDDWYVDNALPILDNPVVEEKNATTSVISFGIKSEGLTEVTESGIVFGTTSGLSIENGTKVAVMGDDYEVELTGLTDGTKYYVRAYAINSYGTSYSKEISFHTPYSGYEGFLNLSEAGTANCYIVPSSGRYMFDASVMGNSNEPVGEFVEVEVLWETADYIVASAGTIVRDVELKNNLVAFVASGIEGNALIAVKDAAGVILWSWHIWVTDTPKDQFYYNGTGTFFVQDRNLGAIRADKGTGDGEWKESFGMYYQWGRKDPFVAGLYTIGDKKIALATSIAEPTVFPATDSHWLISDDYELWNSSEKTIYDPCPPGYIIGSSDLWNSLRYQQIENVDNGWELMIDDVYRTWIPASSWIDVYGSPMNYNDEVYLWSGTYNKSLHIYNQSVQVSSWRLNNGFAVRCMSEKGPSANLQTDSVTEVTKTSAVLNGSIEYLQDGIISEMGFLWSTSKDFIDANTLKVDVCEGKFSATLNNLKLGTTYYVRTYAIDNGRTVYGTSQNFMLQNADTGEDIPEGDEYEW